jgi:hypothetical protein
MKHAKRLRPGDVVEVRAPIEILQTLEDDATTGGLPFMPEMIEFCGKRFRVSRRVTKTCAFESVSTMRVFKADDVVLLDGLRCSGIAHDGCQKACMIFWREAWLRRVEDAAAPTRIEAKGRDELRTRLRTKRAPETYFCQASELFKATNHISRWARLGTCISEVREGNCSALEMAQRIGIWLFWKLRKTLLGEYAHGNNKATPAESLNLKPGELIEVKSMKRINETLNPTGHNRGLFFSPDMSLLCGRKQRVERKLDKIIVDGTGEMRQMRNTVYLEGSHCGCAHVALGGCPRGEFSYWREIWLRRPPSTNSTGALSNGH